MSHSPENPIAPPDLEPDARPVSSLPDAAPPLSPAAAPPPSQAAAPPRGGVREVALLAYPVILTQMSMTTMGLVGSAMVGSLGATELAAVGFGGIWLWTSACFLIGTSSAVQTFVSQHHGGFISGGKGYSAH